MKILVKHGSNVNEKDDQWGKTPLHYAAEGNTEWTASIVEFLLDHGANVHCKDRKGRITLHHAAFEQSEYREKSEFEQF